jgi:hypothetical protein
MLMSSQLSHLFNLSLLIQIKVNVVGFCLLYFDHILHLAFGDQLDQLTHQKTVLLSLIFDHSR